MKHRRKVSLIAGAGIVFSLAGSALLLHRIDQLRPQATLEDVLYISSPKLLKRASLGYDGLLADIYWTRAVQYFGFRHHNGADGYKLLAPLLEITTQLDPHLTVAYEFGASFLAPPPPSGAGEPERAIQLMEYGIRNNPDDWRLYYDLGFVYYMNLQDYRKAADAFERGSKVPNAHPFLRAVGGADGGTCWRFQHSADAVVGNLPEYPGQADSRECSGTSARAAGRRRRYPSPASRYTLWSTHGTITDQHVGACGRGRVAGNSGRSRSTSLQTDAGRAPRSARAG